MRLTAFANVDDLTWFNPETHKHLLVIPGQV